MHLLNIRRRHPVLAGLLAALLLLAACAAPASPTPAPLVPDDEGPAEVVDFPVQLYQGADALGKESLPFSEVLAQGRPVMLNFWAAECPACRLEMPDLEALHEEYGDRLLVFGLDVGPFLGMGTEAEGRAMLQEMAVTFPAGTTSDAAIIRTYQVLGTPTAYFIRTDGTVMQKWTGRLRPEPMKQFADELVRSSAPAD